LILTKSHSRTCLQFLYIEPVSTFAGFYYAFFHQREYMDMTMSHDLNILSSQDGSNVGVSTRESIVLNQLANMYLAFALNEGLVLRSTRDVHVWRVYLFVLLLADFGHLYSVVGAGGSELYWQFWKWNAMYWGNLGKHRSSEPRRSGGGSKMLRISSRICVRRRQLPHCIPARHWTWTKVKQAQAVMKTTSSSSRWETPD
jgi:hypothetical protein